MSYYTDHSDLLHVPRVVSALEGAIVALGIDLMVFGLFWPGLFWPGLWVLIAGVVGVTAHVIADSDPMCSRRFEKRRIAKIKADQAAGIWPRA